MFIYEKVKSNLILYPFEKRMFKCESERILIDIQTRFIHTLSRGAINTKEIMKSQQKRLFALLNYERKNFFLTIIIIFFLGLAGSVN